MPPVLFFNAPRQVYRDIIVDKEELFITREPVGERPRCLQRPPGVYNVAAILADLSPEYREPSLVMCQWDCEKVCIPCNLAPVKCPKVLLVGDTHHLGDSLTRAVRLAMSEPWDLVVLEFNERHCHWFTDAGVKNVAYIPCFTINPIDIPPPAKRTRGVTCCGSMGEHHVRRRYVVDQLRKRGIDVECFSGTREQCAKIYNESVVSLNISLNGDLNLRNYEIAAAAGCKINERSVAGCMGHNGIEPLANICRKLMDDPRESIRMGENSHHRFWNEHAPANKINALRRALDGKDVYSERENNRGIWPRLYLYEQVQELARQGQWHAPDFADLPNWSLYE